MPEKLCAYNNFDDDLVSGWKKHRRNINCPMKDLPIQDCHLHNFQKISPDFYKDITISQDSLQYEETVDAEYVTKMCIWNNHAIKDGNKLAFSSYKIYYITQTNLDQRNISEKT